MAKYNYDKSVLKGLGVGDFLGEVKLREKHIADAEAADIQSIFNSNVLAEKLHPNVQFAKVSKIIDHGSAKEFELVPDKEKGTESLAFFRAGQYISIAIEDKEKGINTTRPYTICSGPNEALGQNSHYNIVVKSVPKGIVSNYILENWEEGTQVMMSAPVGTYYYTNLRDAKHVIALAGGSGITPFYSMASSIAAGLEDFKLTILYGSRFANDILLKDQLDAIEDSCKEKIKIVHVLSDDDKKDFEKGFITADLIKKYAGKDDYSVFVCGPTAMYNFVAGEISKLDLPQRRVRWEVPGENLDTSRLPGLKDSEGVTHKVVVHVHDETTEVEIPESTTLMRGLENAGIHVPADCRSGKCGWCRSRLISGDVYIPIDDRREADDKFGWIHPCCTYAKSDCEIEVFPNY